MNPRTPRQRLRVSIIIPVLNEAPLITEAIEKAWRCGADEVIVADGGSDDATISLAEKANCKLVQSPPGRGQQLNAGAGSATGDVLLFLHVDNSLEQSAADQIRMALGDVQLIGGGFRQRIDSPKTVFRAIEFGNYLRVKTQRLVYGDQGIFIRRLIFEAMGGFPEIPLMEDFAFSQNAFQGRQKPAILEGPLHVNARRWEQRGALKQTIKNWWIALLFRFGASPESLYRRYYQD